MTLNYSPLAGVCGFVGSVRRPWAVRDLPGIIVFPATAIGVLVIAGDALFWRRNGFHQFSTPFPIHGPDGQH